MSESHVDAQFLIKFAYNDFTVVVNCVSTATALKSVDITHNAKGVLIWEKVSVCFHLGELAL